MTYQEIISQVARRLGHQAFANQLKEDYRWALNWCTEEMAHHIALLKLVVNIPLDTVNNEYDLPLDFKGPAQYRFIDMNNNEIQSVEVTFEEYLRWNPNPQIPPTANDFLPQTFATDVTIDNARLGNKIVFHTMFANGEDPLTDANWKLLMKPTTQGQVEVLYYPEPATDPFSEPNGHPPFPDHFHRWLIYGSIKYLADIEAGQARAAQDWNAVSFYNKLAQEYDEKFKTLQNESREESTNRTKMPFVKSDAWYDNPRKYR